MKNHIATLGCLLFLIVLNACKSKERENNATNQSDTPQFLQSENSKINNFKRSNNLVDDMYDEMVLKKPELKKLEDELERYRPKPYQMNEIMQNYNQKSVNYYRSANQHTSSISDSLLKQKIEALIVQSEKTHDQKTADLNAILNQISKNTISISDKYTILKIVTTLPIIEKFQTENKPNKQKFNNIIINQKNIIQQIDSLITKENF